MKVLLITFVISLFSIKLVVEYQENSPNSIERLQLHANVIQSINKVDIERRQDREKIFGIINRFNPEMTIDNKSAIADEIIEMSKKYPNLNVDLICATITHESGRSWNPKALSPAGAMGLMQIMPSTGEWLARIQDLNWTTAEETLFHPVNNIRIGACYLSALIEMYDLEGGLAAYNGGGKRAAMWLANNKADGILWTETQNYIPYVLKLYDEFRML